ncbi:MAG TPA: hypothetical protein VEK32_11765 [Thermodesulfobacteriota bacterium]|nr:hypothetical protein [Thermodesulfobacteriota bacterium]
MVRIRGFFLLRRYTLPIFIILLLLYALVVMSLRAKLRKRVELFDALLMEISFPFEKAATLVIKIVNLGNVQINNKEVQLPPSKYRKSTEYHYYWINGV